MAAADGTAETTTRTVRKTTLESSAHNARALSILRGDTARPATTTVIAKSASGTDGSGVSKQLGDDPFSAVANEGLIIEAPFDMLTLSMLPEHSTEMRQCIDAMEVNIDGFGHRFVPYIATDDARVKNNEDVKTAIKTENTRLDNFFRNASATDTFTQLRRKMRCDLETTGNGYWEVIRRRDGGISGFEHAPSYLIRLGKQELEPVKVQVPQLVMQDDGSMKIENRGVWRRFRRFVQSRATFRHGNAVSSGFELVWFKEFGDPREYDSRNGQLVGEKDLPTFPPQYLANELLHFRIYSARTPYGLPRYVGNLISIFGSRAAEEINFLTFKNNNIPSMAVTVSGGQLTQGTLDRIAEFVDSQIQGSNNYSKFLIIEAETASEEGDDPAAIRLQIQPLTKEQHTDALFVNYQKSNGENIRCSWRLPPIFVGRTDDYTRSTADSSRRLADEQVFAPERDNFDETMNKFVLPTMGIVHHAFKTNSPNTTDNAEMVAMLSGAERTGGMTPRIARTMLSEVLSRELPAFPANFDADVPFSLTMAEAVKNMADTSQPGQTVTALKSVDGEGATQIDNVVTFKNARVRSLIEGLTGIPMTFEGLLAERDRLDEMWSQTMNERATLDEHKHDADTHT